MKNELKNIIINKLSDKKEIIKEYVKQRYHNKTDQTKLNIIYNKIDK